MQRSSTINSPATVPLRYTAVGDGPPILLLHGLFGAGQNWGQLARTLADTAQVFRVDLRNHGGSPWHPAMTYADMAADVAKFIQQHITSPPTIIGHSMGGKIALTLAAHHPHLVTRLALVDITPVTYPTWQLPTVHAMQALELRQCHARADAGRLLAPSIPDSRVRAFLLQNLVRGDSGLRWRLNLTAIERNMAAIAGTSPTPSTPPSYAGPTFAVYGTESEYVDEAGLNVLQLHCPNLTQVEIKDAGHWVHADQPDAFRNAIETFIRTTSNDQPNIE